HSGGGASRSGAAHRREPASQPQPHPRPGPPEGRPRRAAPALAQDRLALSLPSWAVPPTLVWATDAGVDWLVLRGVTPEALVRLRSLAPEDLPRPCPVFPSGVLGGDRVPAARPPFGAPHRVA